MNPEHQLKAIADQIREHQLAEGLSQNKLCAAYGELGSTKTWARVLEGDLDGMDLDEKIRAYQGVLTQIEMQRAHGDGDEVDYADFAMPSAVQMVVAEALREKDNNRFIVVTGDSGAGKTTIIRTLVARWPKICRVMEPNESERESLPETLRRILLATRVIDRSTPGEGEQPDVDDGDTFIPPVCSARMDKVLEVLKRRKLILLIDEGHHFGLRTLNTLKGIINQTPTIIVLFAIPRLLQRMQSQAYEEAKQLLVNRLGAHVRLGTPGAEDVATFMARRGVKFDSEKTAGLAADKLAEDCVHYGLWKFVKLVTRRARKAAAQKPVELATFAACLAAVKSTRFSP